MSTLRDPQPQPSSGHDVPQGSGPIEEVDETEAWRLLESVRFGRLATRDGEDVDITPLNFAARDGRIFFRTAQGSKLLRLTLNSRVALEADSVTGGQAWSVVVHGEAREVTDTEEKAAFEKLGLRPWLDTEKLEVVEVTPVRITARRFRLG